MKPATPQSKKRPYAAWKVFSVRLRKAEGEEFDAACEALGVARNTAIRKMVREVSGFLEPDQEVVDEVRAITRQIDGIANNINQIAKVANRTGQVDVIGMGEERLELGRQLVHVESLMQRFLNVGERKQDGLKRLEKALDDE